MMIGFHRLLIIQSGYKQAKSHDTNDSNEEEYRFANFLSKEFHFAYSSVRAMDLNSVNQKFNALIKELIKIKRRIASTKQEQQWYQCLISMRNSIPLLRQVLLAIDRTMLNALTIISSSLKLCHILLILI